MSHLSLKLTDAKYSYNVTCTLQYGEAEGKANEAHRSYNVQEGSVQKVRAGCRGGVGESDGEAVRSLGPPLWQLRGARRCVRTIRAVPVTRDLSG